jgi:hypothetical protein
VETAGVGLGGEDADCLGTYLGLRLVAAAAWTLWLVTHPINVAQ